MPLTSFNRLVRHPSTAIPRATSTISHLTNRSRCFPLSPLLLSSSKRIARPSQFCRTFNTTRPRSSFTLSQLLRTSRPGRRASREKSRSPILSSSKRPHMSGVCLRVGVTKPKKPNSGERKTCRVRLSNGKVVDAFIPGEGHNVQQHSVVLVKGGRLQDCPGVRYKCVRGAKQGDLGGVASRKTGRSKYGTKMPKTG